MPRIHWGFYREPAVGQFWDGGHVQEDKAGGAGAGAHCGAAEGSHPDPVSLGAVLGAQAFWDLATASGSQRADPGRSRCFD